MINKLTTQSNVLLLPEKKSWNKLLVSTKGKNQDKDTNAHCIKQNCLYLKCGECKKLTVHIITILSHTYTYILLHEQECNTIYVAQGIDVDPRVKPESQHQPTSFWLHLVIHRSPLRYFISIYRVHSYI